MHMPALQGIISRVAAGGGGGGTVVSVEQVTVAMSGTSTTVALTKSQDATQCVPFASVHTKQASSPTSTTHNIQVDVWDDAGTPKITLTRWGSTHACTVIVQVVEFVSDISVQKISFVTATSTTTSWTETVTAVDQGKTFVVLSTIDGELGGLDSHEGMIRTSWDSDTILRFDRGPSVGGGNDKIAGLAYLVEDTTGDYFTVTEYLTTTTGVTTNQAITAVAALNKTWLVTNGEINQTTGGSGPYRSAYVAFLTSTTNIRFNNWYTGTTHTIKVYVVQFLEGTTVQTGTKDIAGDGTDSDKTWAQSITTVDPDASIAMFGNYSAWLSQLPCTTNSSWQWVPGVNSVELDSDGEGITGRFRSDTNSPTFRVRWQVIEFDAG